MIQKVGVFILILLSINFLKTHFKQNKSKKAKHINLKKAYQQGVVLSILNVFAIPFYFSTTSILLAITKIELTIININCLAIGSVIGSYIIYSLYASLSKKMESKLNFLASKMNLILGCLTGAIGLGNMVYLY